MAHDVPLQANALPPTTLQLYSATSLKTEHTDLLHPLTALINLCYSIGHTTSPHGVLLPYSDQRLPTKTSLIREVGNDGFVLVLFGQRSEVEKEPIASASAKPFKELGHAELLEGDELLTNFKRRAAAPHTAFASSDITQDPKVETAHDAQVSRDKVADAPKWEIICNVVHPDCQKRGIAGQMFNAVIEEIRKRGSEEDEKGIHLVITTLQELNEVYYQKRGFRTTAVKRFEKGVGGSEVGLGVVEMERMIGVEQGDVN
ncbi:MAG: hypothetical protein Q9216_003863 [Gyalolechia sp. 2 TL-2023]